MKIINLTPHTINFVSPEGKPIISVEASGIIARVSCRTVETGAVNGIPTTENSYGEVEGLPEPEKGVIYVVSSLVAGRCKERDDIYIPNEPVRDSEGRIVGCKSLGRV